MSFQVGIGCLGGTMFFQVGLCTPLRTVTYTGVSDRPGELCFFYLKRPYSDAKHFYSNP